MNENFIKKIKIDKVRHLENVVIPLSEEKSKHLILMSTIIPTIL